MQVQEKLKQEEYGVFRADYQQPIFDISNAALLSEDLRPEDHKADADAAQNSLRKLAQEARLGGGAACWVAAREEEKGRCSQE